MSIIDQLCRDDVFKLWELEEGDAPERYFWYTDSWADGYNRLDRTERRIGLERETSERGRISGLISDFVSGIPLSRLITPVGYGSDPVAKRLSPPRDGYIYLRTGSTQNPPSSGVRCFGLFRSPNRFYALAIMQKKVRKKGIDPIDSVLDPLKTLYSYVSREADMNSEIEQLITP